MLVFRNLEKLRVRVAKTPTENSVVHFLLVGFVSHQVKAFLNNVVATHIAGKIQHT